MKELSVFALLLMFFFFSGFTTSGRNLDVNVPAPEDKIFWNLDFSYYIVHDADPCVRVYTEKLDGCGYDFEYEECP